MIHTEKKCFIITVSGLYNSFDPTSEPVKWFITTPDLTCMDKYLKWKKKKSTD